MSGRHGDNRERRKKIRDARDEGESPSAQQLTTGAPKQREHLRRSEDSEPKQETPKRGK